MSTAAAPVAGARTTAAPAPGIYLSAGEPSGDEYLAGLARALRTRGAGKLVGMAGVRGRRAGVEARTRTETLTAMGFAEVVRTAPAHVAALRRVANTVRGAGCASSVLIDYPGYHLRVARVLRREGVPVLQYVAPQLWAWRPGRIVAWRAAVRHCAAVLPFEADYFNPRGLPTTFVGHPLLDSVRGLPRAAARDACGVGGSAPVLALFPGSRPQEIRRMWPSFRDAARALRREAGDLEVVVASSAPGSLEDASDFRVTGDPEAAMRAADAVVCKSGTSTLLAALCGTPMVVAYRAHPLSYALARRLVTVPHIALVNVIAGREVVPELIQDDAHPAALARAVRPLLTESGPRGAQQQAFGEVVSRLGTPGVAQRVAALALELGEGSARS